MTNQQVEIVKAIGEELHSSSRQRRFKVLSTSTQPNTVRINVRPQTSGDGVELALEGGVASWSTWASPVVSVSVEESAIHIHRVDAPSPAPGVEITVSPPRFLESLLQCWRNEEFAEACFSWATHALVGRDQLPLVLSPLLLGLRERQQSAYSLLSYRAGFLWGPPGTGKTTTAAAMVADLVTSDPNARVLLVGPTNSAVDLLLVAVDTRLSRSLQGQIVKTDCARIGTNFVAKHYEGRKHLLPEATDELVIRKALLEAAQPSPDEVEARARWQREMERILAALRSQVRTVLKEKRVVAMTATLATMHYNLLREGQIYDLIVFDEASQLGRAVSLMLAPLASRALIAGDPNQLPPILKSDHPYVRKWFGDTLFEYMHDGHPSTCFLNEQSRMATAICGLVSKTFYRSELRVSQDCLNDDGWCATRKPLTLVPFGPAQNLHLIEIGTKSESLGKSHRRPESAQVVVEVVQRLLVNVGPGQILILTPFVAQRTLIRKALDARGIRKIRVSTVHAAQGAEMHTVIFDAVKGNSPFLMNPKVGRRLLNVAISRAQACFVLLASNEDLKHPLLSTIADYIRNGAAPPSELLVPPSFS